MNICVIGAARTRTTLVADALRQVYPYKTYVHEPGLLISKNHEHLDYSKAVVWSIEEIQQLRKKLNPGYDHLVKIVAGATYFDLSWLDLRDIADNCKIVMTKRPAIPMAISYLAAVLTKRFFGSDSTDSTGPILYVPEEHDSRLFWYVSYSIQAERWEHILRNMGAEIQVLHYDEINSYEQVLNKLGYEKPTNLIERIQPPREKSYQELFANYEQLHETCSRLTKAIARM